ncbi:hypothetical protein K8W59_16365 [Nocardioides rotundus]|uniref:hypothetical protein n=1 Tax=Nocardioides rotundus TaxID=1774216 RepID=UPI001CBBCC43|nr:hypothetical protein [Nocardioides rotundus]UAL29324.1 hypothetical protein K8W59_16365 [Nocardioides rotundus]
MAGAGPVDPVDLVVHLGTGKTGTTVIQQHLRANPGALASAGALFPASPGRFRHTRFGMYLRPDGELVRSDDWRRKPDRPAPAVFRRRVERQLRAEVAAAGLPTLLLSDEALFSSSPAAMDRLREFADGWGRSLRLVVYLRRQDDHLASRYQQVVKAGGLQRLDAWAAQDRSSFYDYAGRLALWQERVGPDHLAVRPFERAQMRDGSIVTDFLDAAGLSVTEDLTPAQGDANESVSALAVEMLRVHNLYLVEHQGARPRLIANGHRVGRLRRAGIGGPTLTLPDTELDAFMGRWDSGNERVARDHLGTSALFRAPRRSENTTSVQALPPERLPDLFELFEVPAAEQPKVRAIAEREADAQRR